MNFKRSPDDYSNVNKRHKKTPIDDVVQDNYWKTSFDSEQLDVIRSPLQDCALMACPGSGKTHVCVGLIDHLLRDRQFHSRNILVIMFGRDVKDNFIKRLAKIGTIGMKEEYVRTIHSVAGTILSCLGKYKFNSTVDTVVAAAESHLCNLKLDDFKKACPKFADIKVIIVDEAQDISGVQYDFIKTLKRLLNCFVYMVGDSNQNIFQFQGGSDEFLRSHAPENRKYLIRNYRSTAEIIDFANEHRPWKDPHRMIPGSDRRGDKPYWFTHDSRRQALDTIIKEVQDHKVGTIAIIGPFKINSKVGDENPHCIGLNSVLDRLRIEGLPCNLFYDVSNDEMSAKHIRKNKPIFENMVNLLTIHASKGLEFDKVILIDFHFRTFKSSPSSADYRKYQYLWFVAMTRSKFHLSIHSIVSDGKMRKGNFPWPGMTSCKIDTYSSSPETLCMLRSIPEFLPFTDKVQQKNAWCVSELVNEMTNKGAKWDERHILAFENKIHFREMGELQSLWTSIETPITSVCDDYPTLVGTTAHYVVEAAYTTRHKFGSAPSFVQRLLEEINLVIELPQEYNSGVFKLCKRFGAEVINGGYLKVKDLVDSEKIFSSSERDVVSYIRCLRDLDDNVFIHIPSSNYWFDKRELRTFCKTFTTSYDAQSESAQYALFLIALYFFQRQHNLSHLMRNSKDLFTKIQPFLHQVVMWVYSCDEFVSKDWKFEVCARYPCLLLSSRADAIDPNGTVVEFKFTGSDFTYKHKLQTLLTFNNTYPTWDQPQEFRLINLRKGTSQMYSFNADKITLLTEIVNTTALKLCDVCLLYDLKTTRQNLRTGEAIERYFYEPTLKLTVSSGFIRPNHLPLPREIEDSTGIRTEDVSAVGVDSQAKFRQEVTDFLQLCEQPILIAYDGKRFNEKYLCSHHIAKSDGSVIFLDSCSILRLMPGYGNDMDSNETLADAYERIIGLDENHSTQSNVEMMQDVMEVVGILDSHTLKDLALSPRTFA